MSSLGVPGDSGKVHVCLCRCARWHRLPIPPMPAPALAPGRGQAVTAALPAGVRPGRGDPQGHPPGKAGAAFPHVSCWPGSPLMCPRGTGGPTPSPGKASTRERVGATRVVQPCPLPPTPFLVSLGAGMVPGLHPSAGTAQGATSGAPSPGVGFGGFLKGSASLEA